MIKLLVVLLNLDHGLLERGQHALRSVEKQLSVLVQFNMIADTIK